MNQVQPISIAGIYEVCIGVTDLVPQLQYWDKFGYRIGQIGELPASAAGELYGVLSKVRSVRLQHQDADRGLIRLMVWETPTNDGLQMSSMKVKGNRWATTLTADLLNILNHAEDANSANLSVKYTSPHWEIIYTIYLKLCNTLRPPLAPPC